MSKTTGNVVKPLDLVDTVGVDGFRYYILADTPYGQDGDFTYDGLVGRYNADLANNLGNLMARVATVVGSKCGGTGPPPSSESPLAPAAADAVSGASAAWDAVAPSRALEATWLLVRATNAHLEAHEPWKLDPGPQVEAVLGDALEALRIVAILASPAIPATAQAIWERIGLAGAVTDQRVPADVAWGGYPGGLPVVKGPSLFPRITT
jgi:methionyl-tRNA synthetase